MSNNFNTSTTGVDIEFSVFADSFRSQEEFNNTFKTVVESDNRSYGLYHYTSWGEEEEVGLSDLKALDYKNNTKHCLLTYALGEDWNYYSKTEIRAMKKQELIDLIESDSVLDYMDLNEIEEWASDNSFGIGLDNYEIIKTRGYSQGDMAQVLVRNELLDAELRTLIDHLFWDAPTVYTLVIDGEDYYIDEHIEDSYEYDADEVYKICKKLFAEHEKRDVILGFIKENTPEYPEYC